MSETHPDDAPPRRNDHDVLRLKNRIESGWTGENYDEEESPLHAENMEGKTMNTTKLDPGPDLIEGLTRELENMRSAFEKQISITLGQMTRIHELRSELASARERAEMAEARAVPICIGRQIIGHLARDGQWVSKSGAAVIAGDQLFRDDPYDRIAALERTIAAKDAALRAADDDIREHLQVCKYNLRGEMNTGEFIGRPKVPQLVHEAGIARSEVVRKQVQAAIYPDAGKGWLTPEEAETFREEFNQLIKCRDSACILANAWRADAMRFYLFAGEIAEMAGTYPDRELLISRWKQTADTLRATHNALVSKEVNK